jgi:hypothetical protein
MTDLETIRSKFETLRHAMDERMCRLWAGCEARSLGYGGLTLVAAATGLDIKTVRAGVLELDRPDSEQPATPMMNPCPEVIDLIRRAATAIPWGRLAAASRLKPL